MLSGNRLLHMLLLHLHLAAKAMPLNSFVSQFCPPHLQTLPSNAARSSLTLAVPGTMHSDSCLIFSHIPDKIMQMHAECPFVFNTRTLLTEKATKPEGDACVPLHTSWILDPLIAYSLPSDCLLSSLHSSSIQAFP